MSLSLGALANAHPSLQLTQGDADVAILDITFDSRQVKPGTLFVALAGARVDGHDFLQTAIEKGASAVLVQKGRAPRGIPSLETEQPREVLGFLATAFFGNPSHELTVVGVTGTNGKTTTSAILEHVLANAGRSVGVVGTIGHRYAGRTLPTQNTTPESLVLQRVMRQMCDADVEHLVMEVSSHGLATHRVVGTNIKIGVFTNFSQDHLDFHGSMEEYRDTKARLFLEVLPSSEGESLAILNVDDPEGQRLASIIDRQRVRVQTVGTQADWCVSIKSRSIQGSRFTLSRGEEQLTLMTPMLGDFNVMNAAQAALVARELGVSDDDIVEGIASLPGVPGRMERVGDAPVFVDYAHTPDALELALKTLVPHTEGDLWVVFGCGGDRDRDKRPQMGAIASQLATRVVVTSDNPRHEVPSAILEDIMVGVTREDAIVVVAREEAIALAIQNADLSRDVILIAGKGHETYQEIGDVRHDFDDRAHARDALRDKGDV